MAARRSGTLSHTRLRRASKGQLNTEPMLCNSIQTSHMLDSALGIQIAKNRYHLNALGRNASILHILGSLGLGKKTPK